MPPPNKARRIAMLIDGDNAQPALMEQALAETEKHGTVITRRVYGNWANFGTSTWKAAIHVNGMLPVQQFAYVPGKNATDMALIIEAMDILHSGTVDGFCIVSSDSDYTRLAIRIREAGMFVMGIGRSTTPKPFVAACEVFAQTDSFVSANKPPQSKASKHNVATKSPTKKPQPVAQRAATDEWVETVTQAIANATKPPDGWANLAAVGAQIRQLDPTFNCKDYGYRQLGLLIKSRPSSFTVQGSKASTAVRVVKR
ncbi:MAG: NYN domain-containing protein [Chloroflexi bacterium]|nr:NYN domain-containing protein [Chloroflexota bacterium]